MKKLLLIFSCFFLFSFVLADWNEGDDFKMHAPQVPDPFGYDVNCTTPWTIADDWQCSATGDVTDFHFWISFKEQKEGDYVLAEELYAWITNIHLSIHSDIPVGQQGNDYSMPGDLLWEQDFVPGQLSGQVIFRGPEYGVQGWYDPWAQPPVIENDHDMYYQVNITLDRDPFFQDQGTIYWLDLSIALAPPPPPPAPYWPLEVGWKTSIPAWFDTSVYYTGDVPPWNPIYIGTGPYEEHVDQAFVITGDGLLPVELSSFFAAYSNGLPMLFWETQSESNNSGWNVYRNDIDDHENSQLLTLELIPGAGTTSTPTPYTYVDEYDVVPENSYWYWIESVSMDQETQTFGPVMLTIPGEGFDPVPPEIFNTARLYNSPNPFNPNTVIYFDIDAEISGTLKIYDIKGNLIRNLGSKMGSNLQWEWNSTDDNGRRVPSGVYLIELKTAGRSITEKMVLTK